MRIDVTKPLVQKLLADGDVRVLPDQRSFAKPDLAAELIDGCLRLGDQRLLRSDLGLKAGDHGVDGVDLVDRVVDLRLDVDELVLVVDLLPDALVVGDASLIYGRRIARVAEDGRGVVHRLWSPRGGGQDCGDQQASPQTVRSSRNGGRRCSSPARPTAHPPGAGPGRGS